MDSKQKLRTKYKSIRKTLDIATKSKILTEKIRKFDIYQNAEHIMIYYPLKYEINLLDLLNDNKKFYLPKVNGLDIDVCPYSNELELSEYNIKEPCSNPVKPEILDLIIVPAIAVDRDNNRLGYGKGYYDRFLAKYPKIKTVTLIPKELIIKSIPEDKSDIKIQTVLSA